MILFPVLLALVFLFHACGEKPAQQTAAKAPPDALFEKIPATASGIDFTNTIQEDFQNNILQNSYLYNGGGVAVIDYNKDDLPDLYFTSTQGACKLYKNEGNFKFTDVAAKAGVEAAKGEKTGVCVVDINADGWQDLYVCRTGMLPSDDRRNLLFINNQQGGFEEKGREYGLADGSASNHAVFFDADNDGDLDCYVLNYPVNFKTVNSARVEDDGKGNLRRITTPDNPYESDKFYRNNGNNTFSDVGKQAGIYNRAFGLSVTATDVNNDGFMDIIVGNDYIEPDFVYINNPAQPGNFSDRSADFFRHSSNHTMGIDFADINNDGYNDLMALDMLAEPFDRQKQLMSTMVVDRYNTLAKYGYGYQQMRNVLQINNGRGSFSEIACVAGVFQTDWSWAPLLQDFDNDGFRDLFISNGYRRDVSNLDYLTYTYDSIQRKGGLSEKNFPSIQDYLKLIPSTPIQSYCYRNRGDLSFENVSTAWGLVELKYSNGAVYADLDKDGDQDLVVNNLESPALVYRNRAVELGKSGRWLQVKTEGAAPNTQAIGAKVLLKAGEKLWYGEVMPNRGFLSSVETILQFGVGNTDKIDRLEVEFPGAQLLVLENVPTNQRISLSPKEAKPGKITLSKPAQTPIQELAAPAFQHREDDIQDFSRERLLPWKLSTPGPALAIGDVNKDGQDDFYIGNAAGQAGALFIQRGGNFQAASGAVWEADKAYEDADAVFLDADGDQDLDLCVSSGGNSYNPGDANYQPRLYKNDGKGNFSRDAGALPNINGSCAAVAAFDYDQDGDQDLVLGGWCVPLSYPAVPSSYILRNDQGKFTDVTDQVAPFFRKIGMVRAIALADLNGDKKPELLVSGEWMAIEVISIQNGRLERATESFGFGKSEGFWRSLTPVDLDGDGDMDLAAGNLGLNTRYRCTPDAPLRLFAKDFDNNGSMDPIMTFSENGQDMPFVYRDVLLKQLPGLKKKYVRYGRYGKASVRDMFSEKELDGALVFEARYLGSAVWINEGGKFNMQALPNEAQVSPINGIVATNSGSDGPPDLLVAGNDYGQQVETGRIDAGNGLLLKNNGKGLFSSMHGLQSGFWATREVRALGLLRGGARQYVVVANNNDKMQLFLVK